jgi:hypothetical protein
MSRIDNLPQHFIDEHTTWHHTVGTGGADFLRFHGDFVRRVLEWYGTQRNDVWPWPEVPYRMRQSDYGWDTTFASAGFILRPNGDRSPHHDVDLIENRRPFEIPEPLDAFAPRFASEEDLGTYIWDGVHQLYLHKAASLSYGEPDLQDFHRSPFVTEFYQLHGMIEEWYQAYLRGAYRCGFGGNQGLTVSIEQNAVASNAVEFVLQSAPWITWWKQVVVPNGHGGHFILETKDDKHEDRNGLWADEINNGQQLSLWAGGFWGIGRPVADLGNLQRLPPGSRITFRWVQDWDA